MIRRRFTCGDDQHDVIARTADLGVDLSSVQTFNGRLDSHVLARAIAPFADVEREEGPFTEPEAA